MVKKLTIEEMKKIAEERGGRCLSENYINTDTKLKWECAKNHTWEATPSKIKRGRWCPKCAIERRKNTIEDMQKIAEERGGKCLSEKYFNGSTKLEWECIKKHTWEATPSKIKQGTWCPDCVIEKKKNKMKKMEKIAEDRGGKCLSKKYINAHTKLEWKCEKGHIWEASPGSIKRGRWCRKCAVENKKNTIAEMQKIAEERSGSCLSENYINSESKLKWECEKGHTWEANPHSIKRGTWCPRCAIENKKNTFEETQKIAEKRGGKCISKEYINCYTKLEWECEKGHTWETTPNSIKQGSWCPKCAIEKRRINIEDMQKIAEERGGKCLSEKNISGSTKLEWECEKGHTWEANPNFIKQGSWCPKCAIEGRKNTIEDMQKIAEERGGKCLSKKYINCSTKLEWECAKGHIWEAKPKSISGGTWCPKCGREWDHILINYLRDLAQKRKGRCHSDFKYINKNTQMEWECAKGHTWEATPLSVVVGWWCPECRQDLKGRPTREQLVLKSIDDMKFLAGLFDGECLSDEYINTQTKLKWRCRNNHTWESNPENILKDKWCPECAIIKSRNLIEDMQKIAEERGGKCLSKKYINSSTKLKWICRNSHIWEAKPNKIKTGRWCPKCAIERRKNTIEDMQKIAEERGGKCLSEKYFNGSTKLEWECAKGHTWEASPHCVKLRTWCPKCAIEKQKNNIEDMQKIVEERGGRCLSKEYINAHRNLKWECAKKHTWEAIPFSIKKGRWCPKCAVENRKNTIEEMQKIAEERGGKCLSKKYINAHTKLEWECAKEHIWEAKPHSIKRGTWCPKCAIEKHKCTIEEMQALADSKGGNCLSDHYTNNRTKLKWECAKKHIWEAPPSYIKIGNWCPICRKRRAITS